AAWIPPVRSSRGSRHRAGPRARTEPHPWPHHASRTGMPEMTAAPVHPGAGLDPADLAGLLAAFNDVTAKLQASHEQLRAEVSRLTRELGEANAQLERSRRLAALGEMAAGIAHEVRNPLGSIRLYARMLEEDLAHSPSEQTIAGKI